MIIYCLFCWWFSGLYWLIGCLLFYCLYLLCINYILSHSLFAILLIHYYSINQSPHSLKLIHTLSVLLLGYFINSFIILSIIYLYPVDPYFAFIFLHRPLFDSFCGRSLITTSFNDRYYNCCFRPYLQFARLLEIISNRRK